MKKNNKGFTLVELVVVSCMLVIMMGAILNFVKPITTFYKNTWATTDSNDIGNAVMNYFEDELRYSTNMLILEDYKGMPAIVDGYLSTSTGAKATSVKYTNVIILDNENKRGTVLSTYDATDSPAHRKGATGSIIKADVASDGVDIANAKIAVGEELYSDFKAEFTGSLSNTTSNKCLSIGMKLYKPVYENGAYHFDDIAYEQQRDVELVNINAIGNSMKCTYFTDKTDDAGNPLGTPINYSTYAQASNPGGLTANQGEFYSIAKNYTYIFYTKSVPTSAPKCKFKYSSSGSASTTIQYNNGSTLTDAQFQQALDIYGTYTDWVDGTCYIYTVYDYQGSNGKLLSDYKTESITENIDFTALTTGTPLVVPEGYAYFVERYDDMGYEITNYPFNTPKASIPYYSAADAAAYSLSETVTFDSVGRGNDDYIFVGWNTSDDGSGDWFSSPYTVPGGDITFYAVYDPRPQCKVTFKDADDTLITEANYPIGISNSTNIIKPADPTPPDPDQVFVGWFEDGDKTKQPFDGFSNLTTDIVFKAVYEPKPASGAHLTAAVTSTPEIQQTSWYPQNLYKPKTSIKLKIENVGTEASSGSSTITLKMNGDIEKVECWDNGVTYTISGDTITFTFNYQIYHKDDTDGSHWRKSYDLYFSVYGNVESDYDTISALGFNFTDCQISD